MAKLCRRCKSLPMLTGLGGSDLRGELRIDLYNREDLRLHGTRLAMEGSMSPSTPNQAVNALVFVRNESSRPQKVRELAMLTAARAKDCPYIWNAHVGLGRQAGLSDALVDALRDREPLPPMPVEEAVVIKLGMEFFQTNRVNQDTFNVALEQFGPQGLVELTTLMG